MTTASLLDGITVESPCTEDWDAMRGDDRVRHCLVCRLDVVNLSAMGRDEAEALLASRTGGRACVRLRRRRDGTVVTDDCLTVAARLRRRVAWAAAACAALLGLGSASLAAMASESGGLGVEATWRRDPFDVVASFLPASWLPQAPVVMGAIACPPGPVDAASDGAAAESDDAATGDVLQHDVVR